MIPAGKKAEILVTLNCVNEEKIDHILELMIKNGESQFVKLRANIQEPKVCLNRYSINLGKIYAGIQESVWAETKNGIKLKNFGNIPVQF